MAKVLKRVLIVALLVCAVAVFAACQDFTWGPVMGTDSDAVVTGNGSLAVRQGEYLYFINGNDDTSTLTAPEDNYFGQASVKGSIMKSRIAEDGSLTDTAVVVPKMFKTSYTDGGIYVFGDWIYYVTPTTRTDRDGVVQVDFLEYYRTRTDGTETQMITMVEGASVQYVFTDSALIYYTSNTLYKVTYDATSVSGSATVIDDEVTAVMFNHNDTYEVGAEGSVKDYIFYLKASDNENVSTNVLYATDGGNPIKLIDEYTWSADENEIADREHRYTIALLGVGEDSDGVVLYYTKAAAAGVDSTARTFGYKFTGTQPSFDPAAEVKLAESALSSVIHIGLDKGVGVIASSLFTVYSINDEGVQVTEELEYSFSASPTVIEYDVATDTLYYVASNNLYKAHLGLSDGSKPSAYLISEADISTSWLPPAILEDKVFYIDNTFGYTFFVDLDDYSAEPNNVVLAESAIASGYESSDKTEDGRIPKFMTDTDKETYIDTYPAPEEEQ